ncbi:hypothetical protein DL766_009558 [Monosporascus sp. MC13-8B]|uniref:NADH-ubiquinone reductase complex 1 MLRQ subunit n=1 Tax=Monosporascus cannonballus TaxID=155416 RepID=A0ABY0HLI9_9PEZI|nr:hypothetical protein DL762_001143 [Monosporascus cannonballus]RYO98420.1 hypothetical protein DL763_002259 [Monosporascus cannonballus]RYP14885.1 hypothetical protein DL766_009558 [Monosporascus sp. MC13-8B]
MYSSPVLRMMPSARMMRPVPKEDQTAHTVSQRLRKLRKIPAELIPLGVVVGFAVFAAGYSSFRKFSVDKNLRLTRQNRKDDDDAAEHH